MGESRVDYCKRLMKKALVIYDNLGMNESKNISKFIDKISLDSADGKYTLNDHEECKCETREDVLEINNKKYCLSCYCYIETKEQ